MALLFVSLLVVGDADAHETRDSGGMRTEARVAMEGLGGLLIGGGGFVAGSGGTCWSGEGDGCSPANPLLGILSTVFTIPLGVWLGGETAGRDGEYVTAFIGTGIAGLVAIPLGTILFALQKGFALAMATGGGLLLVGSLLGYELIDPNEDPEE